MDTKELIAIFICVIPAGFVCAFPVALFLDVLRKMFVAPWKRNKVFKKARDEGHIVEAKLVKTILTLGSGKDKGEDIGIYEYEYNGKKYKYRGSSLNKLPETCDLYFEKNPRKACPSDELGFHESPHFWRLYLVCSIVFIVILFFIIEKIVR